MCLVSDFSKVASSGCRILVYYRFKVLVKFKSGLGAVNGLCDQLL